jgi:hypothetical protein
MHVCIVKIKLMTIHLVCIIIIDTCRIYVTFTCFSSSPKKEGDVHSKIIDAVWLLLIMQLMAMMVLRQESGTKHHVFVPDVSHSERKRNSVHLS